MVAGRNTRTGVALGLLQECKNMYGIKKKYTQVRSNEIQTFVTCLYIIRWRLVTIIIIFSCAILDMAY